MSIRLLSWSLAALPFAALACTSEGEDDSVASVNAALSASAAEGDGLALGTLAFPIGADAPRAVMTGQQRVDQLRAWVASRLTCATATPVVGDDTRVVLQMSQDCTWAGRKWTGTITITYSADEAALELEGLAVNGASMSGDMTVTRLGEGHVTVSADWTTLRPSGRTVTGAWDAEWTWDDASYTVVSATHQLTIEGRSATLTKSGVTWQRDEVAPSTGTVTFTGFRGRTWTMTFGRDDAGQITITVDAPRGTRTFTIAPQGEPEV